MEGRQKRKRTGCDHGSFSSGHTTFPLDSRPCGWALLRWPSLPPMTICIWGWAALRSLPPHDNLHPHIYIEVKAFPERKDRKLQPHHIPPLSFKVTFGDPGAGGVDMDSA